MKRKPPAREYYAIGEVCEMLDLKPHVLRYWEQQFPALAPPKSRQGNRLFRPRDLELIALIRQLVHEERYTIEGARQKIEEMGREGQAREAAGALERSVLRALRRELEEIQALLEPSAG